MFEKRILSKGKQRDGKKRINFLARAVHIAKASDHKQFKIITPKQMLQILAIALAQVKAGKTSENLLNEIRQVIYFLYRAKEITKNVYDNVIK